MVDQLQFILFLKALNNIASFDLLHPRSRIDQLCANPFCRDENHLTYIYFIGCPHIAQRLLLK